MSQRHGYTTPDAGGYAASGGGYAAGGGGGYADGGGGGGYAAGGGYSQQGAPAGSYGGAAAYGSNNPYAAPGGPRGYAAPESNGSMGGGGTWDMPGNHDESKGKSGKKSMALHAMNNNVILWACFFAGSLLIYYMLSGGDFSFLMTYGALSRMFGFAILNFKTFRTQKATGISVKTLQLYSIVFFCRLTSIFRHEGYLPYDKSGDWLYHLIEFLAFACTASALYGCSYPFKDSYQAEFDKFGEFNVPPGFGVVYIIAPVFLVALFIHPNLNSDLLSDVAWTFAMYLESCALMPQLYMFQKQASGVVELLTAHFVFALGFGRLLEFCFWAYSYHELAHSNGSKLPGYVALFAQFMQLVLMLDFFWFYYLAVKNSTPLVLPSHSGLGVV